MIQKSLDNLLFERRQHGDFRNLVDFTERVDMGRKEIEKLILVGAFDGHGLTQPEMMYQLDGIYGRLRPSEPTLFQSNGSNLSSPSLMNEHPGLDNYTLAERCLNELYLMGYMLSGNILEILDCISVI